VKRKHLIDQLMGKTDEEVELEEKHRAWERSTTSTTSTST